MDGNTALGASSPAKPALHIPEPLSTTKAATSSSHMLDYLKVTKRQMFKNNEYARRTLRQVSNVQRHVTAFIIEQNWAAVQQHHADHIWSESIKES